jgi:hypothetical protein
MMVSDSKPPVPSNLYNPGIYAHILYDKELSPVYRNQCDKYFLLNWSSNHFFMKLKDRMIKVDGIYYALILTHTTLHDIASLPLSEEPQLAMSFRRVHRMPTGFVLPWII